MIRYRLIITLVAAFVLSACAKPVPLPPANVDTAWDAFVENYRKPLDSPGLSAKASFLFSRTVPNKQSGRLSVNIWGNLNLPLRMNATATFGKTVAMMREDEAGLTAYYPDRKTAYWCQDPVVASMALGLPLPFSLQDLARLAGGSFNTIVPNRYTIGMIQQDRPTYTFAEGPVSLLQTDSLGRPMTLEGEIRRGDQVVPWRAEINGYDDGPKPERIVFTLQNGDRGVLRIRSRELTVESWSKQSLELNLPDKTVIRAVCAFPKSD